MTSRGIHQLKNIRMYFCDKGGSSIGVREAMKSTQFVDFVQKNQHLNFEINMRRNHHPYISSTYINGFVKDVPLRNMSCDETMHYLKSVNQQFGRRPLKHNSIKVMSDKSSIQGKWANDDKWNNYPKHLLEVKHEHPEPEYKVFKRNKVEDERVQSDLNTRFLRKKFMLNPAHKI